MLALPSPSCRNRRHPMISEIRGFWPYSWGNRGTRHLSRCIDRQAHEIPRMSGVEPSHCVWEHRDDTRHICTRLCCKSLETVAVTVDMRCLCLLQAETKHPINQATEKVWKLD